MTSVICGCVKADCLTSIYVTYGIAIKPALPVKRIVRVVNYVSTLLALIGYSRDN